MRARLPRRLLRHPALHFALLGMALLAVREGLGAGAGTAVRERAPIVVSAERVEQLRLRYQQATGRPANAADVEALIGREVEEEALYREALALGLDRVDRGVRWRLVEKMRFLAAEPGDPERRAEDHAALLAQARALDLGRDDPVVRRILTEQMRLRLRHAGSATHPSEAELAAWLAANRHRFLQPARTRLTHVFLGRGRGAALAADARALGDALRRENVLPEDAVERGDAFALPQESWTVTQRQLAHGLGPEFAEAVSGLASGAWSEPLPSAYGLHVVWVHERMPERMPELAEVRSRVLYGLLAERREAAHDERLRALVGAYGVRVERADWRPSTETAEPQG